MKEWVAEYLNKTLLTPKQQLVYPDKQTNSLQVYNNFEVVNLRAVLREDVQHFFRAVSATNYIYTRRWGDGPLRYYMMNIFFSNMETLELCDIDYQHIGHVRKDCNADKSRPILFHLLNASNTIQREAAMLSSDKLTQGVLNVNIENVNYLTNVFY